MQALKEECIVQKDDVVAIGECGIDLHFPGAPESLDLQKKLFALHCELAQELNLPIIVHSRDGFAPTLEVLQNYPEIKVYFHCRGYGPEEVETLKRLSVET
jgi:TatD DNase family protein